MHRVRMRTSVQLELIDAALKVHLDMADHFEQCNDCSDESGLCISGNELYVKVKTSSITLKPMGLNSEEG